MVDRILRLTWRRVLLVVAVWIACVVLHNIIYALFQDAWGPNGDEPFFFVLAVVIIPVYLIVSGLYSAISWFRRSVV
jgi:hypothetical protein